MTSKVRDATLARAMKRVGILYHPKKEEALDFAAKLEGLLDAQGVSSWKCSAWDDAAAKPQVAGSDLVLSIGGDGTILHAARIIAPLTVPILGVNLGKLGFITELGFEEAPAALPDVLAGKGWIEQRAMLEARSRGRQLLALNDVAVRSTAVRLINIDVSIDGEELTTYRADGIVLATATGSTGYSLAAGGPILQPQSREMVLQPISCHLGLSHALVLPPETTIELRAASRDGAMLSLDGQVDSPLAGRQAVTVKLSNCVARFLRLHQETYFYSFLGRKLEGNRR